MAQYFGQQIIRKRGSLNGKSATRLWWGAKRAVYNPGGRKSRFPGGISWNGWPHPAQRFRCSRMRLVHRHRTKKATTAEFVVLFFAGRLLGYKHAGLEYPHQGSSWDVVLNFSSRLKTSGWKIPHYFAAFLHDAMTSYTIAQFWKNS